MRFDADLFHNLLDDAEHLEHENIRDQLLESGIYAHLPIQDNLLNKFGITCDVGDQRCESLGQKLQKFFPEHIIGSKIVESGKKIVIVTSRNTLNVHNSSDLKLEKSIQCDYHATSISCLILGSSFDDLRVFFGSVMGDLIEWRINQGTVPVRRKGHKGMIFAIANDSRRIFTLSDDRTIRMWDIDDESGEKEPICTVFGHTARPFAILVDEVEGKIYTGGIEQTLFTWKYNESSIELAAKTFLTIGVIRKIIKIDAGTVSVGSYDGHLVLVNVEEKESPQEIGENIVNFANLDSYLAAVDEKNVLTVYSSDEMDEIVCRAENVRHLNSSDGSVVAWNGKMLYMISNSRVNRLEMSSAIIAAVTNESFLIVKLLDGILRVFDFSDPKVVKFVKSFKLPKSSMIPSVFSVMDVQGESILIVGTTHGEIFQCILSRRDSGVEEAINRKLGKELFGGKDITCIEPIEGTNCFMTLSKIGNWSTFQIDLVNSEDEKPSSARISILNSRSFAASHRMTWPCRFLKTVTEFYIVGFHGTNLVIWDVKKGLPAYEFYCGGGHRIWNISESFEASTILNFDFIRNGTLCRQKINLQNIRHISHSAHSSPIVCASGSTNFLATVSLDGVLSITSKYEPNSFDHNLDFTMFAGENLLCCDILEDLETKSMFVVSGGGKSKMAIWKFENESLHDNTFWLRSVSRPDEGRIVSVKIVKFGELKIFIASFSSGVIESQLLSLDSPLSIRLFVGTSGSYLLTYDIENDLRTTSIVKKIKLSDRSGVTSICSVDDEKCLVGCDSGNVFIVDRNEEIERVHSHLSTVVGIVKTAESIHSVSLDAAILTSPSPSPKNDPVSSNETRVSKRPTVVHMPGAMTVIGNSMIVAGDGLQSFSF